MLTGARLLTFYQDLWRGSNSNITDVLKYKVVDDYRLIDVLFFIVICKLRDNKIISNFSITFKVNLYLSYMYIFSCKTEYD